MDTEKRYWSSAVVLLFAVLAVLNFLRIDSTSHSASDTLRPFLIETAAMALVFFLIYKIMRKPEAKESKTSQT